MDARRPSEIFLTLWRYRSQTDREETPGDFELCAEAWARIRELEQMAEWEAERGAVPGTQVDGGKEEDTSSAPAGHLPPCEHSSLRLFGYKCATGTFAKHVEPLEGEGTRREQAQSGSEAVPAIQAGTDTRARKREIRDRILQAREKGFTAPEIAQAAGGGVTDTTIYQIINAEKVDIRTYERIGKALDKLMTAN